MLWYIHVNNATIRYNLFKMCCKNYAKIWCGKRPFRILFLYLLLTVCLSILQAHLSSTSLPWHCVNCLYTTLQRLFKKSDRFFIDLEKDIARRRLSACRAFWLCQFHQPNKLAQVICYKQKLCPPLHLDTSRIDEQLLLLLYRCQFHQRFTHSFFVRTSFLWLEFGFEQIFVRKICARNVDEIDHRQIYLQSWQFGTLKTAKNKLLVKFW